MGCSSSGLLERNEELVSTDSLGRPDDTRQNLDLVRVVNRNRVTSDKGEAQWAASSDPGGESNSQFLVHSSPAIRAGFKVCLFLVISAPNVKLELTTLRSRVARSSH